MINTCTVSIVDDEQEGVGASFASPRFHAGRHALPNRNMLVSESAQCENTHWRFKLTILGGFARQFQGFIGIKGVDKRGALDAWDGVFVHMQQDLFKSHHIYTYTHTYIYIYI